MSLLQWIRQGRRPCRTAPNEQPTSAPAAPVCLEAERIAQSLRDYPGDWCWKHKGYELQHAPSGFVLWVGNSDYGLAEVSDLGGRNPFAKPEQAIIWPAVESWLRARRAGFRGRLPKVRLHLANGHWWCRSAAHPWAGAGATPAEAYASWARAVSIQARHDLNPNDVLHVWSARP